MRRLTREKIVGESVRLSTKDEHISGAVIQLRVRACATAGREKVEPSPLGPIEKGGEIRVELQLEMRPIVESRTPYSLLIDIKAQGVHEMKRRLYADTETTDVAGVLGDLGRDEDDV
jgi:hypothetical protein